ncbi:signal peptidase I [Kordiimonas aquimaris]|uniref:signal peptidase I n=1 Tax=Kordiimonas aquimaris TaxID=707591 RepID=UPI0021D294A4|nr:signal peptidase I [Kordiimonas aquimaris]
MFAWMILVLISLNTMTDDCVRVNTTVSGDSLQGQLWEGQDIEVLGFGCGVPERYDYIVFRVNGNTQPIIKQLWGMPGDMVEVSRKGRLHINGEEAKTPFGRPYGLLGSARTRMKKLTKPLDGYLVLGHPGSIDSAKIGLLTKRDLLGYVPADSVQQAE